MAEIWGRWAVFGNSVNFSHYGPWHGSDDAISALAGKAFCGKDFARDFAIVRDRRLLIEREPIPYLRSVERVCRSCAKIAGLSLGPATPLMSRARSELARKATLAQGIAKANDYGHQMGKPRIDRKPHPKDPASSTAHCQSCSGWLSVAEQPDRSWTLIDFMVNGPCPGPRTYYEEDPEDDYWGEGGKPY